MSKPRDYFVFGSLRSDLILFLGTCAMAFIVAFVAPLYVSSHMFLLLLISFLDLPHIVCGLYFMLINCKDKPQLKYKIFAILIMSLIFCVGFTYFYQTQILIVAFAHLSVWHFIRQHQAWFKLAGKNSPQQTKGFQLGNTIASYSATWLLVMASLCGEDQMGWFGINDLPLFPIELKQVFFSLIAISLICYTLLHGQLFLKHRKVMISQHVVLFSMIMVWYFSRHTANLYLRAALIFIPHSVIYFFLLFKSTKTEYLFDFKIKAFVITILFGLIQFYVMTKVPGRTHDGLDGLGIVISLILSLSITHAFGDRLFWNSKDNPGWASSLGNNNSTEMI